MSKPWRVISAERDKAGHWRSVGEPVAGASFGTMDLTFDFATRLNRRDLGRALPGRRTRPGDQRGVNARVAQESALRAQARHRAVLADLRAQVEADAAAEWAPEEIEVARTVALRCSLELAAMTAAGR